MAANDLTKQRARASADMSLTYFSCNILVLAIEGFTYRFMFPYDLMCYLKWIPWSDVELDPFFLLT